MLVAAAIVLLVATVVLSQEVGNGNGNGNGCQEPCIGDLRLLSWGESTALVVSIHTPYKAGMYQVKWRVFNSDGKKVREGNSGWFTWGSGPNLTYEAPMKLLKGSDYYVRAVVKYAQMIGNER